MIPAPPVAGTLRLTEAQGGARLTVHTGQTLEVRLADPSPGGPEWRLTQGPPAIVVVRQGFAPATPRAGSGAPASPSVDVIELRVVGPPGRETPVSFTYRLSQHRLSFAHVWQVRLNIVDGASQPLRTR